MAVFSLNLCGLGLEDDGGGCCLVGLGLEAKGEWPGVASGERRRWEMMSGASKGTPGLMGDPVFADDGFWSLLRWKRSSLLLPPLVGMCQYAETLLSLLFRRCLGIIRGGGTGGIGNLGDILYWNGGDIGIVPMLLLRRRSVDIDKFGGVEANRSWNELPDCMEKLLSLR